MLARGGKSPGTVSKKTYAVVVGRAPGASKVTKAEQLGVPGRARASSSSELLGSGELPDGRLTAPSPVAPGVAGRSVAVRRSRTGLLTI